MISQHSPRGYDRRIWIELIGFDNTHADCGAQAYLETLAFVPESISLLITTPDIVHLHEDIENEVEFPPDYCSYAGHARSAERERQVWTNKQLHRLVSELRKYGTKVFLSTFTLKIRFHYHKDEPRLEWAESHRELLEVNKHGEATPAIAPIKRFADGSYYEDFFIPRLVQTMQDYGFDGWHAADGWGPLRLPIYEGDFSDDIFEQFVRDQGIQIPSHIPVICDGQPEKFLERAEWIWNTQRRQWIDFYTERWAAFYRKKVAALNAAGKEVLINSAWTRDPFEAIYRFGVDYRKIIAGGVDGIVTESLAAACDMQAEGGDRLHEFTSALMLTRASVPGTKLYFLLGIKDTMESWDVLRHAATAFETELVALADIHYRDETGALSRCANGFVACLADALHPHEWRWMEKRWVLALEDAPRDIVGCTLIWSDASFDAELDDFIEKKSPATHRLLQGLLAHGASVHAVARLENFKDVSGPILVLNAHLLSSQENAEVEGYSGGAVFTLERQSQSTAAQHLILRCKQAGEITTISSPEAVTLQVGDMIDPSQFLEALPMQTLPASFLAACAVKINEASGAPCIVGDANQCHVRAVKTNAGQLRVVIENHGYAYTKLRVDVKRAIESIRNLTEFPVHAIPFKNSEFEVKVPGRGIVVLEVHCQELV